MSSKGISTPITLVQRKYNPASTELARQSGQDDSVFLENANAIFQEVPGAICWKDANSKFLGCNDFTARLGGLISVRDIVGKTDGDCIWGRKGFADVFQMQDKETMQGITRINIGRYAYADGSKRTMIIKKFPLINSVGSIIGTVSALTEVPRPSLANILAALSSVGIEVTDKDLMRTINERYTDESFREVILQPREKRTLYYLMRGYSATCIAEQVHLSNRTIEDHVERLKLKLGCASKQQLMEYVVDRGIIHDLELSVMLDG